MSLLEDPRATWEKRFHQTHYSYRDFHQVNTQVLAELVAVGLASQTPPSALVYYLFGTNARAGIGAGPTPQNWPLYGDHAYVGGAGCYARRAMILCTENAWIRFISLYPEYLRQATLLASGGITRTTVSRSIMEEEMYVPANTLLTFNPTYGIAIIFRADTLIGSLNIWIEGNVEGTE